MVVEYRSQQQPGIGFLVKQLMNDINNLLSQHIQLFRYEIREDAVSAAKYTGIAVMGALMVFTSLIFLGFFIIFALALVLPLWAASLIVTLAYILLAVISLFIAKSQLNKVKNESEATVNETKKTVEEAKKWLHDLR